MSNIQIDVLDCTNNPERTVCATARGDEMEMSMVGIDLDDEDDYARVMESVPYDDADVEAITVPSEKSVDDHGKWLKNHAKTRALIRRLIRTYGHFGPYEHSQITFAAEGVSIVVERQVTRHRHVTWDVQSLRYVDGRDMDVHTPESMNDVEGMFANPHTNMDERQTADKRYLQWTNRCFDFYQQMVEAGVPKEDARYVLPMGVEINMTFSMNLRTLMHLVDMRDAANVQSETIQFAKKVLDAAEDVAPNTVEMYREYGKGKSKDAP